MTRSLLICPRCQRRTRAKKPARACPCGGAWETPLQQAKRLHHDELAETAWGIDADTMSIRLIPTLGPDDAAEDRENLEKGDLFDDLCDEWNLIGAEIKLSAPEPRPDLEAQRASLDVEIDALREWLMDFFHRRLNKYSSP